MSAGHETVEQLVRAELAKALGGRRGIVESAVPTVLFTLSWIITDELRTSLVVSIGATVLLVLVRLVQRSTVQFTLNALVGIAVAAVFASRSGEARDVFLPGILYNGAYTVGLVLSIVVGWPLVGFLIGSLAGEPTQWHGDKGLVRLCAKLTWLLALPCALRVIVQYPLWAADEVTLLGAAKVGMGWPLQVAALFAMGWVLSRDRTPLRGDMEA